MGAISVVAGSIKRKLIPATGWVLVRADILGSSSYATNGDTLSAADLGLNEIFSISCMVRDAADVHYKPNVTTDTFSSVKLIAANAAGTEETATTDHSAKKASVFVTGR